MSKYYKFWAFHYKVIHDCKYNAKKAAVYPDTIAVVPILSAGVLVDISYFKWKIRIIKRQT